MTAQHEKEQQDQELRRAHARIDELEDYSMRLRAFIDTHPCQCGVCVRRRMIESMARAEEATLPEYPRPQ